MPEYKPRLGLAASIALALTLMTTTASVAGGGPPAVRVEGSGIEKPFTLDNSDWMNESAVLRVDSTAIEGAVAPTFRQQQLEGRPRVDLLFFIPYSLNCGDDFTMRRACANRVVEFYPATGGEPPYLLGRIDNSGDLVWAPGPHAIDALARLGVPTRIDPVTLSTEAQAGWFGAAALVGLVLASSFALLARSSSSMRAVRA
ncbi:MAG: hypothetical protein R3C39_08550 [Dehalococcoidia bacterium]